MPFTSHRQVIRDIRHRRQRLRQQRLDILWKGFLQRYPYIQGLDSSLMYSAPQSATEEDTSDAWTPENTPELPAVQQDRCFAAVLFSVFLFGLGLFIVAMASYRPNYDD